MLGRLFLAVLALCGLAGAARADSARLPPPLPLLALDPFDDAAAGAPVSDPAPQSPTSAAEPQSPWWKGLTVGSDVFALTGSGIRGGVGGDSYLGYNHQFPNHLFVGITASAGYSPGLFKYGPRGYDVASTHVKVGYDLGRLTPYMFVGVDLAKPTGFTEHGFTSAKDSVNDLFDSHGNLKSFTTLGAGFNYAFSNNLSMGLEMSVGSGHGLWAPW